MAPAVRLIDKRPTESHRHHNVYRTFGKVGINVKKVHDAKGAFYAIIDEADIEILLTDDSKQTFREEGYEVVPPIEYNAMKTVVVRNLDYMIDNYSLDEIKDSINSLNEWAEVEDVFKLPTTSKMLKVRFKQTQMVQTALSKGIVVLHQYIPERFVEKEIFVRLTPCRNCYEYNHKEKDCPHEKRSRCPFCAGEHKLHECKETVPKCLNCGGQHRTLASACRVRKDLIKNKSKEIRERSRSRVRQRPATYAEAAKAGGPPVGAAAQPLQQGIPLSKEETKQMVTVILSAIVHAHYMEALEPGTFQKNIEETYRLNGLPSVKFPTPKMTETVITACKEVFGGRMQTQSDISTDRQSTDRSDVIDDEDIEREEMEIENMTKRQRTSLTPEEEKREKKKRMDEPKSKPQVPPRPSFEGGGGEGEVSETRDSGEGDPVEGATGGSKPKRGEVGSRSRTSSTSSTASMMSQPTKYSSEEITRSLGLTIYVRATSKLNLDTKIKANRDKIIEGIQNESIKFTWTNFRTERPNILRGFAKRLINLEMVPFKIVTGATFDKLISRCTQITDP